MTKTFHHDVIKTPLTYTGDHKRVYGTHSGRYGWQVSVAISVQHGLVVEVTKDLLLFCPCGKIDFHLLAYKQLVNLLSRYSFYWVRDGYVYHDLGEWTDDE